MKIKIQGGTARESDASLCVTCRYASIVEGTSARHQIVRCGQLRREILFRVTSCTEFIDRGHPSLYHMEDIAWVLRTDAKRKQVGFVQGKRLPLRERLSFDDD